MTVNNVGNGINDKLNGVRMKPKTIDGEPVTWYPNGSYVYDDEEPDCKHFHNHDGTGCINTCEGNEPYSCHRAKKESLCHHMKS